MGVRAEQQALAKWGLNYVIEEYLPEQARPARQVPSLIAASPDPAPVVSLTGRVSSIAGCAPEAGYR